MSSERLRTADVEALLDALVALPDADAAYAFLQDVATIREIKDLAQRLSVARMLSAGAHYTEVQQATGASSTTISRVSRCLNYGAGGYLAVIEALGPLDVADGGGE